MKRTLDQLICILATGCMFAFPVLLLGLTPWLGERFLDTAHIDIGTSFHAFLRAMLVMLGSSASILLIGIPAFGLVVWGLIHVSGRDAARTRKLAVARARELQARRIDLPAEANAGHLSGSTQGSPDTTQVGGLHVQGPGRRVRVGNTPIPSADPSNRHRRAMDDRAGGHRHQAGNSRHEA